MKFLVFLAMFCCAAKCSSYSYSYSHKACPTYKPADAEKFKKLENDFRKMHESREGKLQVKRVMDDDCETRSLSFSSYDQVEPPLTTDESEAEEESE